MFAGGGCDHNGLVRDVAQGCQLCALRAHRRVVAGHEHQQLQRGRHEPFTTHKLSMNKCMDSFTFMHHPNRAYVPPRATVHPQERQCTPKSDSAPPRATVHPQERQTKDLWTNHPTPRLRSAHFKLVQSAPSRSTLPDPSVCSSLPSHPCWQRHCS